MSNSVEKRLASQEGLNRRDLLRKAVRWGAIVGGATATGYILERCGYFESDSEKLERGPELTEDHLWDRAFGVTSFGRTGSYLLAAITSPPNPKLKFYRGPINELSDEKFFPEGKDYFQVWRPDGFSVTLDNRWIEIGQYEVGKYRSDIFLFDRTIGAKQTVEEGNQDKIFEYATISFRGSYLSYIKVERVESEYGSSFRKRTIILAKTPESFAENTKVEPVAEIPLPEKHYLQVPPTFSPDEKHVAYVTNEPRYPETNPENINNQTPVLRIFDLETGKEQDFPLFYGVGKAEKMAWSPDSKTVAVYSSDDERGYLAKRKLLNIFDVNTNDLKTVELDLDYWYLDLLDSTVDGEFVLYRHSGVVDIGDIAEVFDKDGQIISSHKFPAQGRGSKLIFRPIDDSSKTYLAFSPDLQQPWPEQAKQMSVIDLETGEKFPVEVPLKGLSEVDLFENAAKNGGRGTRTNI